MTISSAFAARWARRLLVPFGDHISDPRDNRGLKHGLRGILTLVVASLSTLKLGLRKMESLSEDLSPKFLRRMGLCRKVSDTTMYELLGRLSPDEFRVVVKKQVHADLSAKVITNDVFARGVVTFDGKGVGSGMGEAPDARIRSSVCDAKGTPMWDAFGLRACLVSSSICPVLDQEYIPRKKNEMSTFPLMFSRVVTAYPRLFRYTTLDAGFTSKDNATLVVHHGKHYVMALKSNFSVLFPRAKALLDKGAQVAKSTDCAQGCEVVRELRRVAVPSDCTFPHAREFWSVRSIRTHNATKEITEDERIFIVSIPSDELPSSACLKLVRLHWSIENLANWTCDMLLAEDTKTPCTAGAAVLVIGWLRILAYNLLSSMRFHLGRKDNQSQTWQRAAERITQVLLLHDYLVNAETVVLPT